LKDRLSEHLRSVERGAEVVVTDSDRPIARIVPIDRSGRELRAIPPKRPFSGIRRKRRRPAGWRMASSELPLEERQQR
jgi:prevent-host-death family protein